MNLVSQLTKFIVNLVNQLTKFIVFVLYLKYETISTRNFGTDSI